MWLFIDWLIRSFTHYLVYIMTSEQHHPKRVHHRVISSASFFSFQYPLISSRSSTSCLLLLPRLPVTIIVPSIFPSVTYFIRQFLRKTCSVSYRNDDDVCNKTWKSFDINAEKQLRTFKTSKRERLSKLYLGADKSLARPGRKKAAPVKSVTGRGMDWFG